MYNTRSFVITKRMVFEAYKAFKASDSAGTDEVSMHVSERDLEDNLLQQEV